MITSDNNRNPFLLGLCIALGTLVIGLVSFLLYTTQVKKDPPRCEYNGWAYANGEIYDSTDGCNTCFCNSGNTVCTEKACGENLSGEFCVYGGKTYQNGESFKSTDGCNSCGCTDGKVACTLMACEE